MGACDGFDAVGDEFARGQGILHAGVAHGDAVANGDGVEFHGDAAGVFDALLEEGADFIEVAVAGDEAFVRVANADERLFHVGTFHAASEHERAVRSTLVAQLDLIGIHSCFPFEDLKR